MAHDCTADRSCPCDDEELREVDQSRQSTAEHYQRPPVDWYGLEGWQSVNPRNEDQKHDTAYWCLVEEKLEPVHLVLSLVRGDPDGVDGADEHTRQRQENTQHAGLLRLRMMRGFRFVVGDDKHPQAHRYERICRVSRDGFLVEEEIDEGDHRGEEDAGDLVEGDGGVGEGEVLEDDVEAHCCCQGEHEAEAHRVGDEEGDDGP